MKRPHLAAIPLAAFLTLTGCSTGNATGDTAPPPASPSSAVGTDVNPMPPADDATVAPVPEAGEDSRAAALEAAQNAVTAFGRPDLAYQEWINGLYPFLTQTGAVAYEGTDPVNVPVHQVTGTGQILDGSTDVALIVQVPTDAGPYNVSLTRPDDQAPWLADRIRPAGA